MERGLSRLLEREEEQPFDHYGLDPQTPTWPFVVGHFQIDPDGDIRAVPGRADRSASADEVVRTVRGYWRAGAAESDAGSAAATQVPGTTIDVLKLAPARQMFGAAPAQKDEVSSFDALRSLNKGALERVERQRSAPSIVDRSLSVEKPGGGPTTADRRPPPDIEALGPSSARRDLGDTARGQIELPSMTGRVVDDRHLMLYRTVVRARQGYRQGVLIDLEQLGNWLREQ